MLNHLTGLQVTELFTAHCTHPRPIEATVYREGSTTTLQCSPLHSASCTVALKPTSPSLPPLIFPLLPSPPLSSSLTECPPIDHVQDPPWGPHHHMLALLQLAEVLLYTASPGAGMTLQVHVVPKGNHHLVDLGEGGEGRGEGM